MLKCSFYLLAHGIFTCNTSEVENKIQPRVCNMLHPYNYSYWRAGLTILEIRQYKAFEEGLEAWKRAVVIT
jgi:hypothetical protein